MKKKHSVEILPEALDDIEDAREWYNDKRDGLGNEFVYNVAETIGRIQENPHSYAKKHDDIRQARVDRFPYLVSYAIEKIQVIILAVMHGMRDPEAVKGRLKKE